jgi:hypothetical protein
MVDDALVVDAVVHAYNWAEPNHRNELAAAFSSAGHGLHCLISPDDDYRATAEEFIRDWPVQAIEQAVFAESQIDFVAFHSVPLWDYYHDGLVSVEKGVAFKQRNPDRTVLYGAINPLEGQAALDKMERQVRELGVTATKIYPAAYYDGRTLPIDLDDTAYGIPMIEKAQELGIKAIAVHKALPFGPTRTASYRVDDLDEVAAQFPEMAFEIVHAGFAFLEETCFLLGRFPNVYANLEVTASLIINNPRRFAEVLGNLMYWGGEDKIIFASGCSFVHPQPVIEAFMAFEMPQDLIDGYGYPQITREAKLKILGRNFLAMHGLDSGEIKARIAGDKWMQRREQEGLAAPWSALRQAATVGQGA